jgi:hypothetical protein
MDGGRTSGQFFSIRGTNKTPNREVIEHAHCIAVKMILMVAVPASAEVMTKSPSPAQASPQTASPFQATSPPQTMQATPNLQLNCAYFQRNSNGSWTQQGPVTVTLQFYRLLARFPTGEPAAQLICVW